MLEIKAWFVDTHRFWFGTQYAINCPQGPAGGLACSNNNSGTADSLTSRVFPNTRVDLELIDRFLHVSYVAVPGTYTGCGATFTVNSTWVYDVDPVSNDVVRPWYVKNAPDVRWNTSSDPDDQLYTLMVVDAGYTYTHGIYINIQGGNLTNSEVVASYHGPLNTMELLNPYMFLLFRQSGPIQLPSPYTASSIVPMFVKEMNLTGPIAMNWIVATGDEYAAGVMLERGFINMCPLYVSKALNEKTRPFLPTDVKLTVGLDVTFETTNQTFNVCCTIYHYEPRTLKLDPIGNPVLKTFETRTDTPPTFSLLKLGMFNKARNFTDDVYTLLVIDPDVPFPSVGTEKLPLVHMHVMNVLNGNVSTGDIIQPYMGPNPPTAFAHTYFFLLYRQVDLMNVTNVPQYASNECRVAEGRCLFNVSSWVSDYKLTLVGASWMRAVRDDYVIYRNILNNPDLSNVNVECHGQTGYKPFCPKDTSIATAIRSRWVIHVCSIILTFIFSFV